MGDDSATVPDYSQINKINNKFKRRMNNEQTFHKSRYTLLMLKRLLFPDEVHLVLKNDDIFQFHDFHSGKMFGGLRLGTRFVACYEKESGVHHSSTV